MLPSRSSDIVPESFQPTEGASSPISAWWRGAHGVDHPPSPAELRPGGQRPLLPSEAPCLPWVGTLGGMSSLSTLFTGVLLMLLLFFQYVVPPAHHLDPLSAHLHAHAFPGHTPDAGSPNTTCWCACFRRARPGLVSLWGDQDVTGMMPGCSWVWESGLRQVLQCGA